MAGILSVLFLYIYVYVCYMIQLDHILTRKTANPLSEEGFRHVLDSSRARVKQLLQSNKIRYLARLTQASWMWHIHASGKHEVSTPARLWGRGHGELRLDNEGGKLSFLR